ATLKPLSTLIVSFSRRFTGFYRRYFFTVTMCAEILPSTAPLPKRAGSARLDLVSERRALTISNRRNVRRRGAAPCRDRVYLSDGGESAGPHIAPDRLALVMTVRRARQKSRRIGGEARLHGSRDDIGELVLFDAIPYAEDENAAAPEHPARLGQSLRLVGKEHGAELADDGVEAVVAERQLHGVGLTDWDWGQAFYSRQS